jgi:hypothetical protein
MLLPTLPRCLALIVTRGSFPDSSSQGVYTYSSCSPDPGRVWLLTIRSPSPQERIAVATGGRELEVVARQERWRRIERETMMTETMTMEKKTTKKSIPNLLSVHPRAEKAHHNLFRMRPGSKAALSVPW